MSGATQPPDDPGDTGARVDIGMPTRSGGPFLAQAVESVLAQTFPHWRLTISENGPGDAGLAAALAPYLEDARVRHVIRGVDLGSDGNHNALLAEFRAEYVAFLHDDDYWAPEFLERRVEFLDREPGCAFVFGGYDTVDEANAVLATRRGIFPEGRVEPARFVPEMLRANVVGMPTVLGRRAAYDAVAASFSAQFPMSDYELWIRIGARFPVGYLDVVDAAWRFHRRQLSARVGNWGEAWLRFYDAVDRALEGVDGIPVDRAHLRRQRAASHLCAALDAIEAREPPAALEHARRAAETMPRARLDPRYGLVLAAARLGSPGAAALGALRATVRRVRGVLGPRAARFRAYRRP